MKKIGFVDYYISEWHANNYPTWIKEANQILGTDYEVAYAWAEKEVSLFDGKTSAQWCEQYGVTLCDTVEELCEKSDAIIILAPSDPETHLRFAEKVLPFGKRTYIDKTFAPDYETAVKIFDIAKKYNTPFFSSSALRYAQGFKELDGVTNAFITAGGGNFNEYIIHPVEIMVSVYNDKTKKVKVESIGNQKICRIVTESDREAVILYSPNYGYTVTAQLVNNKYAKKDAGSDFFPLLIADILKFFEDGKTPFDPAQTLEAMRLRDALIAANEQDGKWLEL